MDTGSGTLAHPAALALGEVDGALDQLAAANLWSLAEPELLELRVRQKRTLARLQAAILATTREIDGRGAAVAAGATSTAAWLRGRLLLHPAAAKSEVALARDLDAELTTTGAALATGEISRDQAAAIAMGMHRLPRAIDAATRSQAETCLLGHARTFDPASLHNLGRHLVLRLDPEGGEALEREEARHYDRQHFTVVHQHDGSCALRGQLTAEGGALLDAALGPVSAPRPSADGTPDPRPPGQRRAEGLLDLLRLALAAPDIPESGGEPVTLLVNAPLSALRGATEELATLEDGSPISPEATRRLGCDAWLVAAITATGPEVLDIGRMSRTVPRSMRRALVLRDRGCAFPGCGRPARWCHAHHIWHWADGGPTALSNLVLLCGHHHRVVHHDGWDVWIDDTGRPCFRPPPWIDPKGRPRQAWQPPRLHPAPIPTER